MKKSLSPETTPVKVKDVRVVRVATLRDKIESSKWAVFRIAEHPAPEFPPVIANAIKKR